MNQASQLPIARAEVDGKHLMVASQIVNGMIITKQYFIHRLSIKFTEFQGIL